MVSPTKPPGAHTSNATYSSVPNPDVASPDLNEMSPSNRDSYLSPEGVNTPILGRDSMFMPAPSMISRDSTYDSLLTPGTPGLRSSWGSNAALGGGMIGADDSRRPSVARGQSNLQHSTVGWNNSDERMDEDDGQGHIAPSTAAAISARSNLRTDPATMSEKPAWARDGGNGPRKSRKWLWIGLGVLALLAVGLGVGLGIGLTRDKSSSNTSNDSSAGAEAGTSRSPTRTGTASASASATPVVTTGVRGSLITLDDGTEMTYDNPFGGTWVWDPSNPFSNEAQAQDYTKPLNQNWTFGVDIIYGVNLGGWLNTEPFIVPGLYETYATGPNGQTAVDEYTLSQNLGDNLTAVMTEHYDTFITERDFIEIVSAGLNWIRLPIAHWSIGTSSEEPYLERVSWNYVLKALGWARKYGIRVNLDLHTLPGSQNGWNHSGKLGTINWMNGVMGLANAQRALDNIRTLAQFASQPEWAPIIGLFGFNEPQATAIGQQAVGTFYHEMHNMVREITGYGEGNGPMLTLHDGFIGISSWYSFLPGADRISLDQHPYMIFGDQQQGSIAEIARRPCQFWAAQTNRTSNQFGFNSAGEWSAAPNDCGKWVNTVGGGARYDGTFEGYEGKAVGSCDYWNDWTQWDQNTKDSMLTLVEASMDALQNFFFWTWKIGNSTGPITEVNPFWHYRLGLREGWVPKDPRTARGVCASFGTDQVPFSGEFSEPYMTGGPGAGTIAASDSASYPWPPRSFTSVGAASMSRLPQYTQTGDPVTMPGPSYTSGSGASVDVGDGWANDADTRRAWAPIATCSYPPEYSAASLAVPANACGAGLVQPTRRDAMPAPAAAKRTSAPVQRK